MPLVLTTPLSIEIASHEISDIHIDIESNLMTVGIIDHDSENGEVRRHDFTFAIFDDFGEVIEPGGWSAENPTGNEMYTLMKEIVFMRLQELPGDNGLGAGTIT